MAGSEIGIVSDDRETIDLGATVSLPDGDVAEVVDIYDDEEHGREGGVAATLVVDVD
jgi:hypothetical protein